MIVNHTHPQLQQRNVVMNATRDLNAAMDIRIERTRKGQFNVLGVIEAIIFEPDRAWNPTMASADAKRVGRRLYWPDGAGPWLARSIPDGHLLIPYRIALPLPNVPDVAGDDPKRLPYGDNSDPAKRVWEPGDPINSMPMMKQKMESVASAKFKNYLVFQPVAQIQLVAAGRRATPAAGLQGAQCVGGASMGSAQLAALGSHRMPLSSLNGADGTTMTLLIDPKNGEAFFLFGRYNGVDLKG